MREPIQRRIQVLLEEGVVTGEEADEVLAEGYARALVIERERLALQRAIDELGGRVEDPEAARALRRASLRRSTLTDELRELRNGLRLLKESAGPAR